MKKVVQLQYRSTTSGDFGRRLHDEFMKVGISSSIVSLYSNVQPSAEQHNLGKKEILVSRLDNKVNDYLTRKADKSLGLFSYPIFGTNVTRLEQVKQADAIYLHWSHHGFLSLTNMEQLAKLGKPIIVILHDMWYLTGGCHYSFGCEKYQEKCQSCQFFPDSKKNDLSTAGFEKKMKFYAKYDNLYFVSPSTWLYQCAQQSGLTQNKPVFHIPNVLDRNIYKPFDKKTAKEILNIPQNEQVILFGATSVKNPYKGWEYVTSALKILYEQRQNENITVLIFGNGNNQEISETIPFQTRFMGRLNDEYTLALTYNAADVLVAPSLIDNLPYTIFESLACGTPVVAFDTGGIPDMIQHRINGYLAKYKDAEDLAKGISYCLTHTLEPSPPAALNNNLSIQKHLDLLDAIKSGN
ncbi:glycosyltransferase [Haliscomenobacter hydrossis]|uniref:Glycosyl transferase group 1 n=1 Tax=Haliscomenobacter hydrossis (strain ATCC 27775 / DSM 1100 / LMG 10767 / O) TaxID=760192 RepID=F4KR23_HALH1|nr:glycosyltransferase [Haliscomenobacter hydrossis]AEE53261.1 glycosyl transferase group 1 [Haliscomenobacter hydrossis DSM 1100]